MGASVLFVTDDQGMRGIVCDGTWCRGPEEGH